MTHPTTRTFAAGHYEFLLDGHEPTAYIKSVDGGWVKAAVMQEPFGSDTKQAKHHSVVEIDPFNLEVGLAGSKEILSWIQSSWRKDWGRRNGQVTHANMDLKQTFEHWFYDALILETAFPGMDTSTKETAFLKLKLQPERVQTKKGAASTLQQNPVNSKQKLWTANKFRLVIDGLDELKNTSKIEPFTIKQTVKKHYNGQDRFPTIEPVKIEFPSLSCQVALAYANQLHDWYQDVIAQESGKSGRRAEKSGRLEFLSPDNNVLFSISLFEIRLTTIAMAPFNANQDAIKKMKFELTIGGMDLDMAGGAGFTNS
jgi:hypothetical protein